MKRFLAVSAIAFIACAEVPTPPDIGAMQLRLASTDVFDGSELAITGPAGFGALLDFYANDGRLPARALDDTTVAVRLPDLGASASLVVQAGHAHERMVIGTVRVHGYLSLMTGPPIAGHFLPWPAGSPRPTILARGPQGLTLFDLTDNSGVVYPGGLHSGCISGPGPSVDPSSVVLCASGAAMRWRLSPSGDTIERGDTSLFPWFQGLVHLGGRRYLGANSHFICRLEPGVIEDLCLSAQSMDGFRISPRGDRVTVYYAYRPQGVPVLDAATGDVAFLLPEGTEGRGAAFSPNGDTIYHAVGRTGVLVSANAVSGARYKVDTLAIEPWDVAVDPVQPFVYVIGFASSVLTGTGVRTAVPAVAVVDRRTLNTVAVLEAPGPILSDVCDQRCDVYRVVLDPLRRTLLFVINRGAYAANPQETFVVRFALLP